MTLKLKEPANPILQEDPSFLAEATGPSLGIAFNLPSRRRFIPYCWLLYTELNQDETELHLHYTHSVVTLTGHRLGPLQEEVERFQLRTVREKVSSFETTERTSVSRIEITENASQ
jgi:hypothetical protein